MSYPPAPPPAPQQGRTNWGKIALFGCLGLLVLGILITVVGAAIYYVTRDKDGEGAGTDQETVLYRSLDHTFSGVRAQNLVDFSFRYPADWRVMEDENSDTPNYIKVENATDEGVTIENLAVGYITGDVQQPALLDQLLEQLTGQLAGGLPGFRRVGTGSATLAGHSGREATFTGAFETPDGETVDYYGRALLIPATQDRGLAVIAIATELADGVEGPADVGVQGELATIFDSFTLGGAAAAGGATPTPAPAGGTETHQGTLASGDNVRDDGTLYDTYTVDLTAGTPLTVMLASTDFDAYLTVHSPSGQTYSDDDGGGDTNARVAITADETGTWTIWANAYRTGESGAYTLTISR